MRNSPGYLLVLLLGIFGTGGYSYFDSEVITVRVLDKVISDGQTKRGITSSKYVIGTNEGEFSISKFPMLGYAFGAEEVYKSIRIGEQITIRVGSFPPSVSGNARHTKIFDIVE